MSSRRRRLIRAAAFDAVLADLLDETETLLAAMTVEPNNGRKNLINTLIDALIDAGVWAKLDALWVTAAHTQQAGNLNWIAPAANTITVGNGAPTFTVDRGWATLSGANDRLQFNFNPSTQGTNFTQNAASAGYWSRRAAQHSNNPFGWFDGTDGITLNPRNTSDAIAWRINQAAAVTTTANADGLGFYAINRSASNTIQVYKNGTAGTAATNASTALNNHDTQFGQVIGAGSFQSADMAAAFFGGNLNATEHANLYAALAAYMDVVGAA